MEPSYDLIWTLKTSEMNNKEYMSRLAEETGFSIEDTQKLVQDVIGAMSDCFEEGDSVYVPGFGTFDIKKRLERVMKNPVTGQRMLVPPKLVLNFKPANQVKDKIRNGGEG